MNRLPSVEILGIPVHKLDAGSIMVVLEAYLVSGVPHHVVTVNPEFIIQASEFPEFSAVLRQADLAVPDGVGLQWACKVLGHGSLERLPGVDLVDRLAAIGAARGHRFFLLGAAPGVAEATATVLVRRHQGLQVVGTHAGSPDPAQDTAIVELVRAARPDVLLVAYGAPQQDLWISRNLSSLQVPLAIGVGGTFDYLSGRVRRAPVWMQVMGLEWLFRLAAQPWRWRRMLRLPRFVLLVLRQRLRGRRGEACLAPTGLPEPREGQPGTKGVGSASAGHKGPRYEAPTGR